MAKVNYTDQMVTAMVSAYEANRADGMDNDQNAVAIAEMLETDFKQVRVKRSIISKLSREGAYVKEEAPTAVHRDLGPTKKELANTLESQLSLAGVSEVLDVNTIMNSTKAGIQGVIDLVSALAADSADAREGEEA